jgi:hypothetical protein
LAEIIRLKDHKEEAGKEQWLSGYGICLACGYECALVAPVGKIQFYECERCGCEKLVYKYPVDRGVADWFCGCGNTLFRINPDGIYCPMCGEYQEGF